MTNINPIEYKRISRNNLKRALTRREYHRVLNERLKSLDNDSVVVIESPVENYLEANLSSIKSMVDNGFQGVYLSFQRPFKNMSNLFEEESIDLNKLLIIDCATAFCASNQELNPRCINVKPNIEVDEMVLTVCNSLQAINTEKRFVFIDSLSTLALHETFNDTLRFPEMLINTIKEKNIDNVTFIFNIAKGLSQKRYVENLDVYADEHIHLGLCT